MTTTQHHHSTRESAMIHSTGKPNRYPGTCPDCGHRVGAEAGELIKVDGKWGARHLSGDCGEPVEIEVPEKVEAEVGYYVRGDEAFYVQMNRAETHTYAKQFVVSDGRARWVYAPGVGKSLALEGLVPMTAGDAARIGLSHGFCINCCRTLGGESLSAHVSALIGYGETCAKNNGWPYPKGAAAQRAYIAQAA